MGEKGAVPPIYWCLRPPASDAYHVLSQLFLDGVVDGLGHSVN